MIITPVIQAAEVTFDGCIPENPSPEDSYEAMASLGVGPRALNRYAKQLAERFPDNTEAAVLMAFGVGVLAERLALAIENFEIEPEVIFAATSEYEVNEEANTEDVQDMLQITFGVDTPDGMDQEEAISSLMQSIFDTLGITEVATEETGEDAQPDPDHTVDIGTVVAKL